MPTRRRESALSITAADGHSIPALHLACNAQDLVVLSHGITTGKEEDGVYTRFARDILAPTFDSLRFDYRGHGESKMRSDEVTICGELLDLMAIIQWARSENYKRVFHVATSFGASVFLLAASRFPLRDLAGVVFWNPVISYEHTFIDATVAWGREFFDQRDIAELAYRKGTKIPETNFVISPQMTMELLTLHPEDVKWPESLPLLVIHGDRDTTVPFEDAKRFCQRNPTTEFLALSGVDHGFDHRIEEAYEVTLSWVTDLA